MALTTMFGLLFGTILTMVLLSVCLFAGMLAPSLVGADSPTLLRDLVDTAGFSRSDIEYIGDSALAREFDVADRA